MPFARNDGVRIHYEVEGQGPPLIMQHGFGDSLQGWYDAGYVDALKHDHQLILVDARGHGDSDKPHDTVAYANAVLVGDVVAVLHDMGLRQADYWGFSMGGRTGFAVAQHAPQCVRGLILGGAAADGRSRIGDGVRAAIRKGGAEGLAALSGPGMPPRHKARLLANDIRALEASRVDSLGFAAALPTMTMPCLVYAGTADPFYPLIKETVAEMPNVTFVDLPGLGHSETNVRSDLVVPHVVEFLARLATNGGA
jgi:pimeloyl-ACP methyl ester carboxylesterase